MKSKKTVGIYLRNCRRIAGISQKDVAIVLGYSDPQIISNTERGICNPPLYIFPKWAEAVKADKKKVLRLLVSDYESKVRQVSGLQE